MINLERYKKDLLKIEVDFAVDRNTRKIVECSTLDCVDCIFNKGNCYDRDKIEWLYEEYEEYKESILSDDELELIKAIGKATKKEYKYICRSGNHVFIFYDKPSNRYGMILGESNYLEITGYIDLFSNIKFEHGLYDIKNKCFIEV